MEPKLIKTEAEYEAALARVDALMSARPGTADGEALELWVHLVETYEEEHYPVPAPDPVAAIRFRMEQQGLKPTDLIPYLGSKGKVSEVLSGKRPLSLAMIRKLHEGLGISAKALLGRSEDQPSRHLAPRDWREFPLAEMARRQWFGEAVASWRELAQRGEELLMPFLQPAEALQGLAVHPRQSVRPGRAADDKAVLAWTARVLSLARQQRVGSFRGDAVTRSFLGEVARLSPLADGPLVAREMLAKAGIRLVVERHMPRTYLDGAAMRVGDQPPIIALTLRYDRLDHFWFTLCHELAHVVLHLRRGQGAQYLDDLEAQGQSQEETQADQVALDSAIPEAKWRVFLKQGRPSRADLLAFASDLRLHPAIVAGRYRRESGNYGVFSNLVGSRRVRTLFQVDEG